MNSEAFVSGAYALWGRGNDVKLHFKEYQLNNNNTIALTNKIGHYAVINTIQECDKMVNWLRQQCESYSVLGFDCEWESQQGGTHSVALIQLSAYNGICGLFRLCYIGGLPHSLRSLLEDQRVLKVGIAPQGDARKLLDDFNVHVRGTFDLRHLAELTRQAPNSLARMSMNLLNVELNKDLAWQSDWYEEELKAYAAVYAATDAHVGLEIFIKLSLKLEPTFWGSVSARRSQLGRVLQKINSKIDVAYIPTPSYN